MKLAGIFKSLNFQLAKGMDKKSAGLEAAIKLEQAEVEFVPMPIMGDEDFEFLTKEWDRRVNFINEYVKESSKRLKA